MEHLTSSAKGERNVFRGGLPTPANADELLWTGCHVDEKRERVTMPGNGRSTGWNFTSTKFNFFASSCPRKRDRASRKDWISRIVEEGEEGTFAEAMRIGSGGGGWCRDRGSKMGTSVRTDVAFFR